MYAIYHGPEGLTNIAKRVNLAAQITSKLFEHYGFTLAVNSKDHSSYFDTITIIDCDASKLSQAF